MLAVFIKEFQQMMRDRMTLPWRWGVPIIQLVLFGYAINTDPKGLPTAVVSAEATPLSRSLVAVLQNTGYFKVTHSGVSEAEGNALIAAGTVQFLVVIPPNFSQRLLRGERPALLVSVDATDPTASGNAIAALNMVAGQALRWDLVGPLRSLQPTPPPFEVRVHRQYNPEGLSRYNIVPGLIGTILTMTMVMLTALAMTRERERGTMENLLATPVRPSEVMVGKILPYVLIGYVQLAVIWWLPLCCLRCHGRQFCPADGDDWRVHCGQPGGGLHLLDHCTQPVAGDADDDLFLSAVYFAVGLYVPLQRHARVGAAHWRDFAADAFCAHRAGDFAEGQYSSAGVA
jgi:hypothetical protein